MIIYCWHSPEHGLIKIGSTVSAAGARVRMLEYSRRYGVTCDPQSLRTFPVTLTERNLRWRGGWPTRPSDALRGMEASVRFSVGVRLKLLLAGDDYRPSGKPTVPHVPQELLYLGPCSYQGAVDFVGAAVSAHQDGASPRADLEVSLGEHAGNSPVAAK